MKGRVKGFISITEIENYVEELEAEIDEMTNLLALLLDRLYPHIPSSIYNKGQAMILKQRKKEWFNIRIF